VNEWFNSNEPFFSYFMVRTSYIFDDDDICFVLDQHAELDHYSASSLKISLQEDVCCSTRIHYPDSGPTSLYSYSLMMCAQRRSSKYHIYSLWFDPNTDSNPWFTTLEAGTLTITLPMQLYKCGNFFKWSAYNCLHLVWFIPKWILMKCMQKLIN
jgi:hypothetical protein